VIGQTLPKEVIGMGSAQRSSAGELSIDLVIGRDHAGVDFSEGPRLDGTSLLHERVDLIIQIDRVARGHLRGDTGLREIDNVLRLERCGILRKVADEKLRLAIRVDRNTVERDARGDMRCSLRMSGVSVGCA
jgi:hypothetical protein